MPPPLLSRHLRPCQPPWSANWIRQPSIPARSKSLIAGDDPAGKSASPGDGVNRERTPDFSQPSIPQQSTDSHATDGVSEPRDAAAQPLGWWGSTWKSISSFGSSPAPVEAPKEAPAQEPLSQPTTSAARRLTPAQQINASLREGASSLPEPADSQSGSTIMKHNSGESPTSQRYEAGTDTAQADAVDTGSREGSPTAMVPKGRSLFLAGKGRAQLQQKRRHPRAARDARKPAQTSNPTSTIANPVVARLPPISHVELDISGLLRLARRRYQSSTNILLFAVDELATFPPHIQGSVVSSVKAHLEVVARDAIMEGNMRILQTMKSSYNGRFRYLVDEHPIMAPVTKRYRQAVTVLAQLGQDLERMVFPGATGLALKIQDRLRVISREALEEGDYKMRQTLRVLNVYTTREGIQTSTIFDPSSTLSVERTRGMTAPGAASKESTKNADSMHESTEHDTEAEKTQESTGRQHTRLRSMSSANHPKTTAPVSRHEEPSTTRASEDVDTSQKPSAVALSGSLQDPPLGSDELSEQSLLEELFPEVYPFSTSESIDKRAQYPKLDLPESNQLIRTAISDRPLSLKEKVVESFQRSGENIAVLQLEHCSTELTEADFRRLIPKGEHIETWNRDGEFYKVIPGRDPLNLERLPFYYLLFRNAEAAVAYQRNARRLHKLAAMHRPSSIFSAIPAPAGFSEDGVDLKTSTDSYLLKPTEHQLTLSTLMQPYHPALRKLFEQGGYNPIVPDTDDQGARIFKVLLHIEGYEPSHSDLFKIFLKASYDRGISLTLRNETSSSIKRLRDIVNLKTRLTTLSTANPRAYGHWAQDELPSLDSTKHVIEFEDPNIAQLMRATDNDDGENAKYLNQVVMNKLYNRWIIEFEEEIAARRFAVEWHRRVLPDLSGDRTWRDYEEQRICNCEFLW